MKANVCFGCRRFFDEDFSFCPYCGKKLKKTDLSESAKKESKKMTPVVVKASKPSKEVEKFYDTLTKEQQTFIDNFYCNVNDLYPRLKINHTKQYTYFFFKEDRDLFDYGHWFYFSKYNGKFVFKYRTVPCKNTDLRTVTISRKTSEDYVKDTIIAVIQKRYEVISRPKSDEKYADIKNDEKKQLAPKLEHPNVFLPGSHGEDRFFGDLAEGERKTQKEVWEVSHNYYRKKGF